MVLDANEQIVTALVQAGGDVNRHRPDTGFTPLVEVATSSRSVELELLLQQAAPGERVQALEHSLVGLAQALLSGPMETDLRLKVGGTFDFGPFDFRHSVFEPTHPSTSSAIPVPMVLDSLASTLCRAGAESRYPCAGEVLRGLWAA